MLRKVLLTPFREFARNNSSMSSGFCRGHTNTPRECHHDDIKEAIRNGVKVIDVREPSELKKYGKIPKSVNVPLGEVENAFRLDEATFIKKYGFSKPQITSEMVLTCRSGKRATDASIILSALGYREITVYKGSFEEWLQRGELVEK